MRSFLLLFLTLFLCATFAHAKTPPYPDNIVRVPAFTLEVLREDGSVVDITKKQGWLAIETTSDERYSLRITNTTDERIMVVVSIDGIDPFTGQDALLGTQGRVIDARSHMIVDTFKAHRKSEGVPLELDPTREAGVVDVISFRERMDYPHMLPWSERLAERVGGDVREGPNGKHHLQWIPPSGAPFRKISNKPFSSIHIEYGRLNSIHSRGVGR